MTDTADLPTSAATSAATSTATATTGILTDVKPALITDKSKRRHQSKKQAPHLKWDEKAIEEHDQLRGTRMKIDEPNTPYTHYDSGSETDGSASRPKSPVTQKNNQHNLQWDHLERKLDSVAAVRDAYPSSPSSHASGGDGDMEEGEAQDPEERKAEMKELEFKEHRKRHYNEMELVRKFRQEHPDPAEPMAEEEDNDADDEDE
jgi:protein phosphatase inhibitor 2